MLACVDINKLEYTLADDLGLLNYTSNPTNQRTKSMVTPQKMSMQRLPMTRFCKMTNAVIGEGGELHKYRHLIANPKNKSHLDNTIFFIQKNQIPKEGAKVLYCLITVLVQPEKIDEPNRTRLVAGGDRVNYPGDTGTPTTNLLTVKLLINSVISMPSSKFMTMDMADFYLSTPMT